ncbi:phosphoribosylamine--glycine ligase [Paenibacillus popilliae]|uniref:Phosphoribosylamine--glycine ligase n=1 Tax=Paenibacillus popilliae ATCC 14706 TaxID=1212764 RepID=M9LRM1_PAEPP|nr:phosphoribosylamine--glycine ligase [Paenibacillus popilliae]GAC44091.1 phosphoribosylamine-glycine ligase [Paenibacillus popilliae ATCC 14706]
MKVLIIGSGGREHALAWALKQSPKVSKVLVAPGNAGMEDVAETVPFLVMTDYEGIAKYVRHHDIDLVVVGPDDPLADGIVDLLQAHGVRVFGPDRKAAEIEGSKVFMKDLLRAYGIPTAAYAAFEDAEVAKQYVRGQAMPIVIKADGLAAGKGVAIVQTVEEAERVLNEVMIEGKFGASGSRVVIEKFMPGQEMSVLAFVDGETVLPCMPAQDYKPAYDNDAGPNTGGMGTYSPLPQFPEEVFTRAVEQVIKPTVRAMAAEGRPFRGLLFAGLMITPEGEPKVVEFNARFGDPETQVVLPRLKSDLFDVLWACTDGTLDQIELTWRHEAAVCVIVASEGYPGSYRKGELITGLEEASKRALLFHAGTVRDQDGTWRTNGGRVLGIVGRGPDLSTAKANAYEAVRQIDFAGMHYRTDIADKANCTLADPATFPS